METIIQNQAKQSFIYGTHLFWMMDHENLVISLSFYATQTSSKLSCWHVVLLVYQLFCW